jgi:2-oxoglutarate dehydrogenase E1 component
MSSTPRDLVEGRWQRVIDDPDVSGARRSEDVRRLILCGGKVGVDLLTSSTRATTPAVAICRVEQIYPFPVRDLTTVMEGYPALEEVVWVQEEPENMGAWDFVRPLLEGLVGSRRLAVLARPRSSSPAEGSAARHAQNQERLINKAYEVASLQKASLR